MGPADLESMGFDVVAVDILELAVSPGLGVVAAAGGLGRFTGWRGTLLAVVRPQAVGTHAGPTGWRARRRPELVRERDDDLTVRSAVDGSLHDFTSSGLARAAVDLGGTPVAALLPSGGLAWWEHSGAPPPNGYWVISSLAATAARTGSFWAGAGWVEIGEEVEADARGQLSAGCGCRACQLADVGYIAHLWRQREITAVHLLGWHNLHQARLLVEG
jgi:queuine/archaeosine tRNA-ribosyltransferase